MIIDGTPTVRMDSANGRSSSRPPSNCLQIDPPFAELNGTTPVRDSDGLLIGTPLYMAPERWLGHRATPRSDLFALGLLLRELAVGQHPFSQLHGATLMRAILDQDLPSVELLRPDLSPILASAIDRLTRRAELERPASADEVLSMLANGDFWEQPVEEERTGVSRRSGIHCKADSDKIANDEKLIGKVG
jgi:serine/threonine protein kinase